MTVVKREHAVFEPKSNPVPIRSLNGDRYLLENEKPEENEIEALRDELEYERRAKSQAVEINYKLENQFREAKKEIEHLNEEINQLNKEKLEQQRLYKLALDESVQLEREKQALLKLVYYFANWVVISLQGVAGYERDDH